MAGAIRTHVVQRHTLAESICAISVFLMSASIVLLEVFTARQENMKIEMRTSADESGRLVRTAWNDVPFVDRNDNAGMLVDSNFADASCGCWPLVWILNNQNTIAAFLFAVCSAMVIGAARAGLYVQLVDTLFSRARHPKECDDASAKDESTKDELADPTTVASRVRRFSLALGGGSSRTLGGLHTESGGHATHYRPLSGAPRGLTAD